MEAAGTTSVGGELEKDKNGWHCLTDRDLMNWAGVGEEPCLATALEVSPAQVQIPLAMSLE